MIELLVLFTIPIWLPLMALYFSTWNKNDPKYQDWINAQKAITERRNNE